MSVKFKRKKIDPQHNCFYPHPEGAVCVGIHALDSDKWMTLEEIMDVHKRFSDDNMPIPTWGELIRDLGLFICFHLVEVSVGEYERN